jgi:flavin reductase (DIM6/NTAB) family NADH-FMN oxidoreductase RutF
MKVFSTSLTPKAANALLVSTIVPRPIAFVTTLTIDHQVNAAPYSFFNALTGNPPLIIIALGQKRKQKKNTASNILRDKEFAVNLLDQKLLEAMEQSTGVHGADDNTTDHANIHFIPGEKIKVPSVTEAPIVLECVLYQHFEVGNEPTDIIIGEVVMFNIKDELLTNGILDAEKFHPIASVGENSYNRIENLFRLQTEKRRVNYP